MCLLLEEREGKSEVKLAMTIICFDTFGVNNYLLCTTLIDIGAKSTLHHLFVLLTRLLRSPTTFMKGFSDQQQQEQDYHCFFQKFHQ